MLLHSRQPCGSNPLITRRRRHERREKNRHGPPLHCADSRCFWITKAVAVWMCAVCVVCAPGTRTEQSTGRNSVGKGRVATRIQTWVQNATLPSASCAPSQPRFLVPVRGEPESHLTLDRGAGPVAGPALVGIGTVGEVQSSCGT